MGETETKSTAFRKNGYKRDWSSDNEGHENYMSVKTFACASYRKFFSIETKISGLQI